MKLSIIIPCYNEGKTISKILDKVLEVDIGNVKKEIIIVDDASKDKTVEIIEQKAKALRKHKLILLKNSTNHGKGYAIRKALKKVTGDITIIQDADLEYFPSDYPKLIKPIVDKEAKVVYGSRKLKYHKNEKLYLLSWYGTILLTFLANLLYNARITDESTCYKVFKTSVIKSLNLKCERFEFCPEVTAKVRKKGHKIKEVSISYNPRLFEEGKKINWKDGVEAIWILVKYRFVD